MRDKVGTIGATSNDILRSASRRNFIKGVIAGGVAASSASYLFRASTLLGQQPPGFGGGSLPSTSTASSGASTS